MSSPGLRKNVKVIGVKISCHTFVNICCIGLYRVKVSDTKVTHFTLILALCTRLYRSHLQKPVSMKQTKHSRKSEAQHLCSKCPPFTRTHVFFPLGASRSTKPSIGTLGPPAVICVLSEVGS